MYRQNCADIPKKQGWFLYSKINVYFYGQLTSRMERGIVFI